MGWGMATPMRWSRISRPRRKRGAEGGAGFAPPQAGSSAGNLQCDGLGDHGERDRASIGVADAAFGQRAGAAELRGQFRGFVGGLAGGLGSLRPGLLQRLASGEGDFQRFHEGHEGIDQRLVARLCAAEAGDAVEREARALDHGCAFRAGLVGKRIAPGAQQQAPDGAGGAAGTVGPGIARGGENAGRTGAGRNGKSTFADLMVDCFGDYAVSMSIDSFAGDQQRKGSEATPDLARLPAVRLIAAEEPEMGVKLRGALIKKMTGGTKMDVRKLNEDFFEFKPHFKLVISGNHKPVIIDDSDGMWARIKMVPWNVQIPDEEKDLTLPDKLRAEMPAVFAWIVRGALDYLENGLRPPAEVTNATEEYRQESDPIGDFLRNGCSVTGEENDRVPVGVAYAAYDIWAKVNGQLELGKNTLQKRFPKKMEQHWPGPDGRVHQFWRIKTNGEFVYAGLKVLGQYLPQDRHPPAPRYADDDPLPEVF